MPDNPASSLVVFQGETRLGVGDHAQIARLAHRAVTAKPTTPPQIFDRRTGRAVDLDLRGDEDEAAARYAAPSAEGSEPARRGRPRLGVTAREVTLLPRHWDWLSGQSGGASAALRRLVDAARKADEGQSEGRVRRDAAYGFMSAMAGDLAGFEEASRTLFSDDHSRLSDLMRGWPSDIATEVEAILAGD